MKAWQASDRWGCSHVAPSSCPWCENPDAEVWRDTSDYQPIYGFPTPVVVEAPATSLTLAEWVDKNFNGFFERGAS